DQFRKPSATGFFTLPMMKPNLRLICSDWLSLLSAPSGAKKVCAMPNVFRRGAWSRNTSTSTAGWGRNCEKNSDVAQFPFALAIAAIVSREAIRLSTSSHCAHWPCLDFSGSVDHGRRERHRDCHRLQRHRSPPSQSARHYWPRQLDHRFPAWRVAAFRATNRSPSGVNCWRTFRNHQSTPFGLHEFRHYWPVHNLRGISFTDY